MVWKLFIVSVLLLWQSLKTIFKVKEKKEKLKKYYFWWIYILDRDFELICIMKALFNIYVL